jgi:1-acyl-sn-glycerol-3-phosphate acyltransferase
MTSEGRIKTWERKPLQKAPDDLEGRDPDYIRVQLPLWWLLSYLWFRAEVRGMEKIPQKGPALLVGNHSGGNVTPDTRVFALAFSSYFGVERPFFQLVHSLVLALPGMGWARKWGAIPASPENADRALARGAVVLVYPGGDWEVSRPSWESAKIDFRGRKGFLHTAHRDDVPLVPVVSIGGQETALFLSRGESLSKWLGLDTRLRLKTLPISLSLPWGLNVGDFVGHIPLPAKITIEVMDPIDIRARYGDEPDWDVAYAEVVGEMQKVLSRLQSERRLPLLG